MTLTGVGRLLRHPDGFHCVVVFWTMPSVLLGLRAGQGRRGKPCQPGTSAFGFHHHHPPFHEGIRVRADLQKGVWAPDPTGPSTPLDLDMPGPLGVNTPSCWSLPVLRASTVLSA